LSGGYAVSFHAQPRATKDLDILISPDAENSQAVYAALAKFGAPVEGLSAKDWDLLAAKISIGRAQDLADVAALRESLEHHDTEQRPATAAPERSDDQEQNDVTRDSGNEIDDDLAS
jgi:hypothetical protein